MHENISGHRNTLLKVKYIFGLQFILILQDDKKNMLHLKVN